MPIVWNAVFAIEPSILSNRAVLVYNVQEGAWESKAGREKRDLRAVQEEISSM